MLNEPSYNPISNLHTSITMSINHRIQLSPILIVKTFSHEFGDMSILDVRSILRLKHTKTL
ncbi:hypothetical protein RchiOBHm_Chr3g0464401 [Rosa chinensis]|uniref:Uncharacterized protein n=1 Tax=Rosa chinensis TaxID=74649 RepID=A0A2P6R9F5_ROSCH|nr:hypothetical protein RchiOBHm_Chr3g0464401 [Rosa chinensis]